MHTSLDMKTSRYLIWFLFLLTVLSTQPVIAEDIWQGVFSYQKKMAEHGHPEAQIKLGEMYEEGHGTEQNYDKARHWYLKAAEQGYSKGRIKATQLQARERREEEERKRAERQRIAQEQAAKARREQEQAEASRRALEQTQKVPKSPDRQQSTQQQPEAKTEVAEKEGEKRAARLARKRRAEEAMKEMLSTPEAYSEE